MWKDSHAHRMSEIEGHTKRYPSDLPDAEWRQSSQFLRGWPGLAQGSRRWQAAQSCLAILTVCMATVPFQGRHEDTHYATRGMSNFRCPGAVAASSVRIARRYVLVRLHLLGQPHQALGQGCHISPDVLKAESEPPTFDHRPQLLGDVPQLGRATDAPQRVGVPRNWHRGYILRESSGRHARLASCVGFRLNGECSTREPPYLARPEGCHHQMVSAKS